MTDDKFRKGPEENKPSEVAIPPGTDDPPTQGQAVIPGMENEPIPQPASSEVIVDFEKINELMAQRKSAAQEVGEKASNQPATEDSTSKRRGRPPKEQAGVSAGKKEKAAEHRTGRPSKADKVAREEAPPSVRDKVSRGKKADKGKETGSGGAPVSKSAKAVKPGKSAPVKEAAAPPPEINLPPTPDVPPRPVEEGKIVYLKMAELHPFHTFREHPYKLQDDRPQRSGKNNADAYYDRFACPINWTCFVGRKRYCNYGSRVSKKTRLSAARVWRLSKFHRRTVFNLYC